ncbi:unnamed protein product [Durusdinium trenchii]|uniref:S1 motif domain-containing protein n=1 Tax=Durusdinium trenchii TaxID=1381693 RepID=A0ABP0J394_9DINO
MAPSKMRLRPQRPADKEVEVGALYHGIVSYVADTSAHVILGDAQGGVGHEGYLHISQIPGYFPSAREALKVGEKLKVQVLKAGSDGEPMSLSAKLWEEDDDRSSSWLDAKVYNIKPFGIFIEVSAKNGVRQGMVHISQIREGFVEDIFSEVEIGEIVQVRVLSKEPNGRVKFTMLPEA